jgi:rhodanese-related sulfurtransferase
LNKIKAMQARELKDNVYGQLARIGKAVSAPKRIELLELLCQGPRTVESLASLADLSVANASQHLQVLRRAQLVESRKQGLYVEYRLADPQVVTFVDAISKLGEARFAEIGALTRSYRDARGSLERIPADELLTRIRRGSVTVIDLRPEQEYREGHIPGARSIPESELKRRLAELPKHREIVAYCRGRHCVLAVEAAALLRRKGFRAHALDQGVIEWRARGWRVARGPATGRHAPDA